MDVSIANMAFLIIGLLTGFICGYFLDPRRVAGIKEDWQIVKSMTRKKSKEKLGLGTIHRPSAQQLNERGTPIEETKNAMRETLRNDPYFNENYGK